MPCCSWTPFPTSSFTARSRHERHGDGSDVFSGDPAKKFDVVFSVDMRQLLSGLGMKPAEVDGIMATAAANAKKNWGNRRARFRRPCRARQAGRRAECRARRTGPGSGRRRGRAARRRAGGGMWADRQKMQDLIGQWQNSTPAERQKLIEQFRQSMASGPGPFAAEERQRLGNRPAADAGGGPAAGGRVKAPARARRARRFARRPVAIGRAGDNTLQGAVKRYPFRNFTEEERNNAKLPLPPEKDSAGSGAAAARPAGGRGNPGREDSRCLPRPAQAVFERGGKPTFSCS
jgi:hypothetical protein